MVNNWQQPCGHGEVNSERVKAIGFGLRSVCSLPDSDLPPDLDEILMRLGEQAGGME